MNTLLRSLLITALLCGSGAAQAEVRTSISVGFGNGWYGHSYSAYRPYGGYHHYYRPAPLFFGPAITYYSPPVVYIAPAPSYTVYSTPYASNPPPVIYRDVATVPVPAAVRTDDYPPPASAPPSDGSGDWWYCHQPDGFYPAIRACPAGWQRVPATR